MTVVGTSAHQPDGTTFIVPPDGLWHLVLRVDELPTEVSNRKYSFVCWANAGDVHGGSTGDESMMELAFGTELTPTLASRGSVRMSAPQYLRGAVRRVWPWMFVTNHDGTITSTWPAHQRVPAIWARVNRMTEPAGRTQASFSVVGAGILAFDLDAMTAGATIRTRTGYGSNPLNIPAGGRPSATSGTHTWTEFASHAVDFGASSGWVGFSSVTYRPGYADPGPPVFQVIGRDVGDDIALLGRSKNFGHAQRGGPGNNSQPASRASIGGVYEIDAIGSRTLVVRGAEPPSALPTADIFETSTLAVRLDQLGHAHTHIEEPDPIGDGRAICHDVNSPNVWVRDGWEPAEWSRPGILDLECIASWSWLPSAGLAPPAQQSWYPRLDTTVPGYGAVADLGYRWQRNQFVGIPEGVPQIVGKHFRLVATDVAFGMTAGGEPAIGGTRDRRVGDLGFAAWSWENNPDIDPDLVPAVPAPTYIVPGRESLDVASLPLLPDLPNMQYSEEVHRPGTILTADDGTITSWPRWLTVRRVFNFRWDGLTLSERDVLMLAVRSAFRWQPPHEPDFLGLFPTGQVTAADQGAGLASVSGQFVELIWTGTP